MEKQYNTNIRDYLISIISEQLDYPETICEKLISWVYEDTKEQTKHVASIELSGFGNLLIAKAKLRRRIGVLEDRRDSPKYEGNYKIKNEEDIQFLYSKKRDEIQSKGNMGGLEKSPAPSREPEGDNREDINRTSVPV